MEGIPPASATGQLLTIDYTPLRLDDEIGKWLYWLPRLRKSSGSAADGCGFYPLVEAGLTSLCKQQINKNSTTY